MLQSHSPSAQRTDCPNRRAPAAILRLQVVDDASPPRVVRISTRRCSVGGAPSSTVRLRAFGVRPLHCVIQQYRDRTLVRSLCPGNRLNGQPFRQERLQHGDTLTLGPITFRVLLDDDSLAEPLDHRPQAGGATTPASCPPVNPADELPDAFLARIERLENQLAKMERNAQGASGAATETEPSSVAANLVAELAGQRDDLGHQRLEWAEQKQRLDHSLAERMNRLSELESQLTAQQQNRFEVEAAFDRTRVRLAELEDALEQSRQCLQSEQHEYGQQRHAWQTLRGQLEAELAESRRQWADLMRQAELYQQQSQQDRDNWQAAEARLAEVRRHLEELTADLQRQRTEYEQQSTLWIDQKQSLETELEAALQGADQERLAHAAATERWQRQCHELEARLESQHAVLAQQQQQLSELATLRERILHKCDEQQATIEQLLSRCAELETEAARALADTQDKQDWELQRAEFLQQQSLWELDRSNLLGELETRERQISDQRAAIQQIESASQANYRQWEEERGQLLEQLQQAIGAQRSYMPLVPAAAPAETLPAEPAVPLDSDLPSKRNDGYESDDLRRVEDVPSDSCPAAEVLDGPVEFAEQVRTDEATNRLEPQDEGTSEACFAAEPERDRDSESTPDSAGEPSCDSLPLSGVMAQLQQMGVWREDALEPDDSDERACDIDSEGQPVNPALTSVAGIPMDDASAAANEPSRRSGDEDESIESYMNRLLVRLRGPSSTTGYVCIAPPGREQEERAPITEPNWCSVPDPTLTVPEEATDFRPKSLAPEGSVNLAAMRALANDSARTAIAVHRRQSLFYQVFLNMLGALVAMAVCACFIHQFRHDSLLTNVCVIVALAAGAFGLTKYVLYRRAGQDVAGNSPPPGPRGFLPLPSPAIVAEEPQVPAVDTAGEEEDLQG